MSEKLKRTFETLDEAMAALPQKTLAHSKRVASYMRILFLQACSEEELYPNDAKVQARLKESYSDLAYQIGYFHDVGKARIPEEYHNDSKDYSREERALYEKHPSDSMVIVEALYQKQYKCRSYEENWIREAIVFHHELWNGNGFPNHLNGKNIPFFARLLTLADTMDHLFCETLSEHPFEDTMTYIEKNEEQKYDPALIKLVKHCSRKLKRIFAENIDETRTIPEITPFVTPNAARMNSLWFTPVEQRADRKTVAVEADIRFKAKKLWLSYAEIEGIIRREHLRKDLGIYSMLEACDALRRFDACGIQNDFIAVSLPARWFNHRRGAATAILECLKDEQVDPTRVWFILGKDDFRDARVTLQNNIKKLMEAGCGVMFDQLILDGVPVLPPVPEVEEGDLIPEPKPAEVIKHDRKKEFGIISVDEILAIHPTAYRIGPDDAAQGENDDYVAALKKLSDAGIKIIAKDIEERDYSGLLFDLKAEYMTGKFAGESRVADDYVKAELAAKDA